MRNFLTVSPAGTEYGIFTDGGEFTGAVVTVTNNGGLDYDGFQGSATAVVRAVFADLGVARGSDAWDGPAHVRTLEGVPFTHLDGEVTNSVALAPIAKVCDTCFVAVPIATGVCQNCD